MLALKNIFDEYSLRARLLPALLALAPVFIAVGALYPQLYASLKNALVAAGGASGALILLSLFARALGRKKEINLVAKWGGLPTTMWLRHRDENLDPVTKSRYHIFLAKHVPGLGLLPSAAKELQDSESADQNYRSAVKWLLEYTRNKKKFPLVFEELVNYGFQRNMLGLKIIGISVTFITIIGAALIAFQRATPFAIEVLVPVVISIIWIFGWLIVVTEAWVKDASNAYTRALLASCDNYNEKKKET